MPASIDELLSSQHRCSGFRHPATSKLMSWDFKVGEDIVSHAIPARLCTNDVELEEKAVLGGEFIGQLVGVSAAPLIRVGLLVPLLIDHVAEHLGLYAYHGSRLGCALSSISRWSGWPATATSS
ncbi:hypothetical protein OOZ63_11650 [Paucibacter sp. PLA-PC-4]|uniref:hypothetical protein n=1 Tax=Paucibacter sp. PLA-PC-4 TaxID=2993655 RepID=UPI0022497DA4|nr:hypothetical protein [Paucibacter sp. PLA-PC-4]MCX2862496.1 hypothetical protein [Paucibacter sp. PLA-PC-4]